MFDKNNSYESLLRTNTEDPPCYVSGAQLPKAMNLLFKKNWTIEGNKRYLRGDYRSAIKFYSKALLEDELDTEALLFRGISFHDLGNFQKAIEDFTLAIQLVPRFSEAYRNRALSYYSLNDSKKALSDYNTAAQLAGAS